MRVLCLAPVAPWPPDSGGRLRTLHLLERAAREVELELWCVDRPDLPAGARAELERRLASPVRVFARSPLPPVRRAAATRHERWFHSQALERALRSAARPDCAPDLLHLDEPCLVRSLPRPPADPTHPRTPAVVHHHKLDLELVLALGTAGPGDRLERARLARLETLAAHRHPDHLVCCTEDAARLTARHPHLRVGVVPNGFDPGAFPPPAPAGDGLEEFTPAAATDGAPGRSVGGGGGGGIPGEPGGPAGRAPAGPRALQVPASAVLPSAGRAQALAASDTASAHGVLLFLGTLSYGPNVDGLARFVREVLPRLRAARPALTLEVVGSDAGPRVRALAAEPGVRLVGAVEDVRPHLARADLLVAPLAVGGGTRIKIVEALAAGTPVVATPVAAEGLPLEDGVHLDLARGAEALAQRVLAALSNPAAARARAERGRRLVWERLAWPRLAGDLVEHWRAALARHRAGTGSTATRRGFATTRR